MSEAGQGRSPVGVVISARRQFRSRRRIRRRRTARPVAVLLAVAVLVTGGVWVALNSSLVEVREVTVDGTSRLSVGEVLHAADVRRGESLFRLDPGAIAARVARLRPVAHVEVSRRWPHGVVIHVVERVPFAVVRGASGAVLLDRSGMAFAAVTTAPAGLVDVTLGAVVPGAGDADAKAAMTALGALPAKVRERVVRLRAPTPYDVSLQLRGGRMVVWGSAAGSARKAVVLAAMLRRPARVYDVSTPDIVVTRG